MSDCDWSDFRAQVADYEALLQRSSGLDRLDFEPAVLASLARLFSAGASMPTSGDVYEQTGGDAVWDSGGPESDEISADALVELLDEWSSKISAVLGDMDAYSEVYDPADGEVMGGTISDDLADVLGDLNEGARLWDVGDQRQAMWEWSFRFSHWGEHALGAMRAIHMRLER